MCISSRLLASCAVLSMLVAVPAIAADYDPPIYIDEAPEYVPVEIGSGWYLRGDVAYTTERDFNDTALRLDDTIFDASLVSFDPVAPLDVFSFSERTMPVSGSIGVGYHINDFLRAEVNLGLLSDDKYTATGFLGDRFSYLDPATEFGCAGTNTVTTTTTTLDADGNPTGQPIVDVDTLAAREGCGVAGELRNTAWTGTANVYADLGTYAGFTPYVGAGAGLIYTRTKFSVEAQCESRTQTDTTVGTGSIVETTNEFLCRDQSSFGEEQEPYNPINLRHADYNFLYTLNAGVAYQLTQNAKLDVGYQFTSVPDFADSDFHQVKVGLRYDLW